MLPDNHLCAETETAVTDPAQTLTRKQRRREQTRQRNQRMRERKRERARLAAEEEAARLDAEAAARERRDEMLAPAVLRRPVMSTREPDRMLLGPRVTIVDGRPVRAFPLGSEDDPLAKLGRDSHRIKERHLAAAAQLRLDWEAVGGGLGLGAVDYLRAGGGGEGAGISDAMLAQLGMRARLDGALTHLGAFAPAIARIVLDCIPLSVWLAEENARRLRAHPARRLIQDGVAWLAVALDRLVTFYWPPNPNAEQRLQILTLAPPREAYCVGTDENLSADA
jgi:hypothetical protein